MARRSSARPPLLAGKWRAWMRAAMLSPGLRTGPGLSASGGCRVQAGFVRRSTLSSLDQQPVGFAVLAAMAAPMLLRETLFLRLRGENFADLALLLDDDIAALGHAEGLLEQAEMIEFGAGRMLERFEP